MRVLSLALLALAGGFLLLAGGCSGGKAGGEPFRAFANNSGFGDEELWGAYRFAAASPQALRYVPCYCGCGSQGHRSNEDCYIRERKTDGSLVYDPHAAG